MKKTLSTLFLTLLVLSLGGCEIKFTAVTKINPDGSGFRITTYSAEEESEKEELLNRYILPEGGSWQTQKYTPSWSKVERKNHIYEVKSVFKDLNKLAPDYTRTGLDPKNLSRNRYDLRVKKGFIFNAYEYEEVFTDSADEQGIKQFCEREYNYVLDKTSEYLGAGLSGLITKDKFRIFLNDTFRPYYDYFLREFLKDGFKIFEGEDEDKEIEKRLDELSEKFSEDGFIAFVDDYLTKEDKGLDYKGLEDKIKQAHKKIGEELQSHWDELSKRNYDDAFGVYGIPIFVSYPFSITVVMPGRVVNSNAAEIKINAAKWTFSPSDFFLKEYKLEAKSRQLNYVVIAIFAIGLVAILILAHLKDIKKLWS